MKKASVGVAPRESRKALLPRLALKARQWVPAAELLAVVALRSTMARHEAAIRFAAAASLLVLTFPLYSGPPFALVAAFGAFTLLCFPLEPLLSFAGVREPGWWNMRSARNE
jgi:hypothetical protein